jgi:ubiquinone/menaquinone biosynthesis C-methylase UbiE
MKKNLIVKTFYKPEGAFGSIAGWIMHFKNMERIEWMIENLNLQGSEHLLEIGFGPGTALKKILTANPKISAVGVEHSEVMFKQAASRNKKFIEAGRLKLICGEFEQVSYVNKKFDRIFMSNVHFFWSDINTKLNFLKKQLSKEGKIVIVHQPHYSKTTRDVINQGAILKTHLASAGFVNITVHYKLMEPVASICSQAERGMD